jgi:hypothetical protein
MNDPRDFQSCLGSCPLLVICHSAISSEAALFYGMCSYTHSGELCIIFLIASCGEHVNTGFADACPIEMMQD